MKISIDNIENTAYDTPTVYEFEIIDDMYYAKGFIRFIDSLLSIGLYSHYDDLCLEESIETELEPKGQILFKDAVNIIERTLGIILEW